MRLHRLLALGAGVGLACSVAPAAWAGPQASIDHVEIDQKGVVQLLVGLNDVPAGDSPDLGSVEVRVDEQVVEATAEPVEAGSIERTTILALDTSNSMSKGDRFAEAKEAAEAFLAAAPDDVEVGLVTFDGAVQTLSAPSTDHVALSSTIEDVTLSQGTMLYAGVAEAVKLAGEDGARNVLLLSDGADVSSTPLQTAIAAVEDAGVKVDAVALEQSAADQKTLTRITDAAGGSVIPAGDPKALEALFTAEAYALAQQILVHFQQPDGTAGDASLSVSVDAGGQTYSDSAFVSLGEQSPSGETGPRIVNTPEPAVGEGALLFGGAALTIGLATILAVVLLGRKSSRQTMVQRQMAHYSTTPQAAAQSGSVSLPSAANVRDSALAVAESVIRRGDFETTLSQRLTAAGLSLTASEWLLLQVGVAVVAGFAGMVLGGSVLMVLLLVAGLAVPWFYLGFKRSRRLAAFNAQLAETLQLIAGGLSAGLSLPQAVDTVVREGANPMADEMRRALIEQRLGVDIEDALDGIADRMSSDDFRWVVMAIRIQREVGGNLAELLDTVAATLREREYLRRQVQVLSAEGRLSAWILGGLPIVMFVYMLLARPDSARVLYTEPLGLMMLGVGVVMLTIGGFVLKKLVKVEV